jgi:hypothetical protein|tara:strand:- start:2481 stop:2870 length:390 start_codon:yes stop_codon:yes gene_type:complete
MIVLVLIGTVIVWGVIQNIISEESKSVSLESLTLDVELQSVKLDAGTGNATIAVKRNSGQGNLTGLKFIFSDDKNSEEKEVSILLKELQTMTYYLNPHEEKRFAYKNVYSDGKEYKYWKYKVIPHTKIR